MLGLTLQVAGEEIANLATLGAKLYGPAEIVFRAEGDEYQLYFNGKELRRGKAAFLGGAPQVPLMVELKRGDVIAFQVTRVKAEPLVFLGLERRDMLINLGRSIKFTGKPSPDWATDTLVQGYRQSEVSRGYLAQIGPFLRPAHAKPPALWDVTYGKVVIP